MVLENWIDGMRKMHSECRDILLDLCGGLEVPIDFPEQTIDIMTNNTYSYSWLSNATYVIGHQLAKWPILTIKINSKLYARWIEQMNNIVFILKS